MSERDTAALELVRQFEDAIVGLCFGPRGATQTYHDAFEKLLAALRAPTGRRCECCDRPARYCGETHPYTPPAQGDGDAERDLRKALEQDEWAFGPETLVLFGNGKPKVIGVGTTVAEAIDAANEWLVKALYRIATSTPGMGPAAALAPSDTGDE